MSKKLNSKEDVKIKIRWSIHEMTSTVYEAYVNAPRDLIEKAISTDSSIEELLEKLDIDLIELETKKKYKASKVNTDVHDVTDVEFHNHDDLKLSEQLKRANHAGKSL